MNEPEISSPAELHMQRQLTALAELVKRLEGERGTGQRTDD